MIKKKFVVLLIVIFSISTFINAAPDLIKPLELDNKTKAALIERIMLANKYPELDDFSITEVIVYVCNHDDSLKYCVRGSITELNERLLAHIKNGEFYYQRSFEELEGTGEREKTEGPHGLYYGVPTIHVLLKKDKSSTNYRDDYGRYFTGNELDYSRGDGEYITPLYPYTVEEQQNRITAFEECRSNNNKKLCDLGIFNSYTACLFAASKSKNALSNVARNEELYNALLSKEWSWSMKDYYAYMMEKLKNTEHNRCYSDKVVALKSLKKLIARKNEEKTHDFFERVMEQN